MVTATPSPLPAPRVRPGTVNLAVILLYVAAGLEIINAIIAIATYSDFKDAYAKAYAGTSLAGKESSTTGTVIGTVVVAFILAAIFIVLAILDGNGNRVARILTWVLGGLALCCLGSSFALGSLGKAAYDANRKNNPDLPTYDQLQHTINSSLPGWYYPVTITLGVVVLVAVAAIIILLALPASNAYFRKPAPAQWEPPLPQSYPSPIVSPSPSPSPAATTPEPAPPAPTGPAPSGTPGEPVAPAATGEPAAPAATDEPEPPTRP